MKTCTRTKLIAFGFCTVAVFGGAATLRGAGQYASEAQKRDPVLWYRQPGEKWLEAMPIGNSYMGAMVFGGIHMADRSRFVMVRKPRPSPSIPAQPCI
jgi:hypothetical protein